MVVVVVEGIMCHWVTRATAAIKTYQQELIAELLNCASHRDSMGTHLCC